MGQVRTTRTIHTIAIDLLDDVLSGIEEGDEVEVVLRSRAGYTSTKKLTYRDTEGILRDLDRRR